MTTIPTSEPARLVAGDTWQWTRSLPDYPATAWTLTYHFVNRGHNFSVAASADGAGFAITVTAATTAAIIAGEYAWAAVVTNGAVRHQVASGRLVVEQDMAKAGAGFDPRSHAEIVLENIEAVIEGRASKDQESYSIEGRSLSRTPLADLMNLRNVYRAEVKREQRCARAAKGMSHGGQVLARFTAR